MAEAITVARALAVARAATARLSEMVQPDGRFLYRYAVNDPSFVSVAYSNARHAAAVWVLADADREGWPIPGLGQAIDRSARFMQEHIFRPFGTTGALCVLDEGFIKLSGSAHGIAAEARLLQRDGDPAHRDRIVRLARHIASQREADGDFLPARIPGPIARPHPTRDDLTPGQAVMALALATETTGETAFRDMAIASADAFAGRDYLVGRMAHWMLYALEALDRIAPDPGRLDYARRIAAGLDSSTLPDEGIPVACESEGLLALARLLRSRGDAGGEVPALLSRVEKNLRRQLRFFHPSGAFVMSRARPEVRIDTIAHNLAGFLGWARMTNGR